MKNEVYRNAVNHLVFSDGLYERVTAVSKPQRRHPNFRTVLIAALVAVLCTVTSLAVSYEQRIRPYKLGTSDETFSGAQRHHFTISDTIEGAEIHYLSLKGNYQFAHGMLYSAASGFLRITEDYALEPVASQTVEGVLEKGGNLYSLSFQYVDTENGVVSCHKTLYQKNDQGEILLNVIDPDGHQWPVYVNLETGAVRDALPNWDPGDFVGKVCYAEPFRGGFLLTTLMEEEKNGLYWVDDEAKQILLPEQYHTWYVHRDHLFIKDKSNILSYLDDDFVFQTFSGYQTRDDLTDGLFTVQTPTGELGIWDTASNAIYVVEGLQVSSSELDELRGYDASRYADPGRIALVHTTLDHETLQIQIDKIGILDAERKELRYLEIVNSYDGSHHHWLDENRFAVLYENGIQKYLCIYDFQ